MIVFYILMLICVFILILGIAYLGFHYLLLTWKDIKVILTNFNQKEAEYCNNSSCGYYLQVDSDFTHNECLNPYISEEEFRENSQTGKKPGCKNSVSCRANKTVYKPIEYRRELLELHKSFSRSMVWQILGVGLFLILLGLGIIGFDEVFSFF